MPHSDQTLWYAWLIPLFPLIGFLINGFLGPLVGKPLPKLVAGVIGTGAVFLSFAVAVRLFMVITAADEAHRQELQSQRGQLIDSKSAELKANAENAAQNNAIAAKADLEAANLQVEADFHRWPVGAERHRCNLAG